jgi:hypothetical protein
MRPSAEFAYGVEYRGSNSASDGGNPASGRGIPPRFIPITIHSWSLSLCS